MINCCAKISIWCPASIIATNLDSCNVVSELTQHGTCWHMDGSAGGLNGIGIVQEYTVLMIQPRLNSM